MWFSAADKTARVPAKLEPDKATREQLQSALKASVTAMEKLLEKALQEPGGNVPNFRRLAPSRPNRHLSASGRPPSPYKSEFWPLGMGHLVDAASTPTRKNNFGVREFYSRFCGAINSTIVKVWPKLQHSVRVLHFE